MLTERNGSAANIAANEKGYKDVVYIPANESDNKYEFHIDGHIAHVTYDNKDGVLHITHTIVPEALAGKGLDKILTITVRKEIETKVSKFSRNVLISLLLLKKNPEYTRLLG